ncbi:N-succinyl-L,L-diaminopimelate aminotransferase alternative [Candidatus Vidania fulgoroideae]|uniref:N-succinyl-L,L-diaminopimelate aminotransferase alternative n=1 Tax=Candidatus Vidania fulgoroideorum TaxID=881286 RepID=A0A346E0J6_9PROT|nr:N-succinyl-L,L-diaminopimelate aminotransferase alternative [Candidatus Vidania fulgoroideae]
MKILLGLGEPKQKFIYFKKKKILKKMQGLNQYPLINGKRTFKKSISKWINKRNNLSSKKNFTKNIIPSLGNKEGIYTIINSIAKKKKNSIISPDPYYPSYIIPKLFFNKKIIFVFSKDRKSFIKNFRKIKKFKNILMMFICSPNNPLGYCLNKKNWIEIIKKSIKEDFFIISDECYSEIYLSKKPISCIKIVEKYFNSCYKNIFVINSLSKTSSVPGLRSGFIFSSKKNIKKLNYIRNYNGANLSNFNQDLSVKLWLDFKRTKKIRERYRKIFFYSKKILKKKNINYKIPDGGFCIWLDIKKTNLNSNEFCKKIEKKYNIVIYPGSKFSRNRKNFYKIRISLVESKKKCIYALKKISNFIYEQIKKKNK